MTQTQETLKEERTAKEAHLIVRLREGDEAAFNTLVGLYHQALMRTTMSLVKSRASAEEIIQETWLAVLKGLSSFEGRSTFKTWIFRIAVNKALTRARKEGRSLPFSALGSEDQSPAVDPERFKSTGVMKGGWASPPKSWGENPEVLMQRRQVMGLLGEAIKALPERQRLVLTMRDLEGLSGKEVCNVLEISESNQRVLLHRARAQLRSALEKHLDRA